jgi:hypothetical protein
VFHRYVEIRRGIRGVFENRKLIYSRLDCVLTLDGQLLLLTVDFSALQHDAGRKGADVHFVVLRKRMLCKLVRSLPSPSLLYSPISIRT